MKKVNPSSLVGFKAAPGSNARQLCTHAAERSLSESSDWAGIYVQLDVISAFRYLPNQFDRGDSNCCILNLTLQPESNMKILLCSQGFMGNNKLSSLEKAIMLRKIITEDPELSQEMSQYFSLPLLDMLGKGGYALCLIDYDSFELAVPHELFNEQHLEASTLFLCEESARFPCTLGNIKPGGSNTTEVVNKALSSLSRSDFADCSLVGKVLSDQMLLHGLSVSATWLPSDSAPK